MRLSTDQRNGFIFISGSVLSIEYRCLREREIANLVPYNILMFGCKYVAKVTEEYI
jgi:hypothetical protein